MIAQLLPVLRSVQLSTGVTLPYVVQGDSFGIPLILLHGVSDSWHSYEPVLPHLPAAVRAYALTQRGHGDADRPAEGYAPSNFVADVAAFMDALDIPAAVIVGHSLSTSIAERFVIDYPERVRGLVLMGAFRNWRENPGLIEFWQEAIVPLTDPIDPAFARDFQESTITRPAPEAFLDLVVSESLKAPARIWRETFAAFADADVERQLHEIEAPTLILWGDQDAFCPRADQEYLVKAIPEARLVIYEGIGHAVHWDAPQRVVADLAAFIEWVNG
jgi:pimeloyl-ACP methyl ester carboxylesterase